MEIVLIVVLAVLLVAVVAGILVCNRFVSQRNTISEAWRQVDVELQTPARPHPEPDRDRQGVRPVRAGPPCSR